MSEDRILFFVKIGSSEKTDKWVDRDVGGWATETTMPRIFGSSVFYGKMKRKIRLGSCKRVMAIKLIL